MQVFAFDQHINLNIYLCEIIMINVGYVLFILFAVTISSVKPNQHFKHYYLTAEATVPSEANLEQISSSISTSVNEGNNNKNNKTYQVSFSGAFSYYFLSFLYECYVIWLEEEVLCDV